MSEDDLLRLFAAILPSGLPGSKVSQLRSSGRELDVPRGGNAEFNTDAHRWVAYVARGTAKLVGHAGSDREQIVAFALEGDILVLPGDGSVHYSLCGITECRILAFPAEVFVRSVAVDGDTMMAILERALVGFDRSREMSVLLGRKTARERVASFLVSMGERIGASQNGHVVMVLPMSRREIADSLGLTIETVSRQFTELRDLGVVDTNGRSEVSILDPGRMRELAALAH